MMSILLRKTKRLFPLMFLLFYLSGCSLFSSKGNPADTQSSSAPEQAQFKQVVSPLGNPTTTPVEVATEFYEAQLQRNANQENLPVVEPSSSNAQNQDEEEDDSDESPATLKKPPKKHLKSKSASLSKKGRGVASHRGQRAKSYTVVAGDTLMKISFESFGDIFRWREILNANKDQIKDVHKLVIGQVLRIEGEDYIVVDRNGHPYLIRKNDTLLKISNSVYGTKSLWKSIWKNNPQLIKNPNKIYAGLTLYYLDQNQKVQKAPLAEQAAEKTRVPAEDSATKSSSQSNQPQ